MCVYYTNNEPKTHLFKSQVCVRIEACSRRPLLLLTGDPSRPWGRACNLQSGSWTRALIWTRSALAS